MTDGQLLAQFVRAHDAAAFETLVRRHGPMVLRVCQRVLRHGPDADDAFQATFIVLVRRAHAIVKRDSVASWLYGVAYRIALRARVRANRRRARERHLEAGALAGDDLSPHGGVAADIRLVLDEELSRLPEKYRAPIVLCYLQGKTNEEAARQLQWPTGTVKIRLSRARDLLRNRLARRGLGVTIGALALALTRETASAALPATMTGAATQTAALLASGKSAAVAATGAGALAESTVKAMAVVKLKIACAVAVLAGIVSAGAYYTVVGKTQDDVPLQRYASLEHPDGVFAAAFTPDGRSVVTGSGDGIVRIWDTDTGREVGTLTGHRLPILSLAVSSDGALLASGEGNIAGSPGVVKLWDLRRRSEIATLLPHDEGASSLAFAPDGKTFATASWGGTVRLWDTASREPRAVLNTHTSGVARVCFSGDGTRLASASNDRSVKLWDAATGKELTTLNGHGAIVQALAFAPDGNTIASGSEDQTVRLWDTHTHESKCVLQTGSKVHCVSFAPGGRVLLSGHTEMTDGGPQGVLKLWDVASGAPINTIHVHKLQVGNALFSPDGKRLVTTSWDRAATLWNVNTGSSAWAARR